MGIWSFYFLAKLGLHASDKLVMIWWANLALALFLSLPQAGLGRWVKHLIGLPLAATLIYQESALPPFSRVLQQWDDLATFNLEYLIELAGRFVQWTDFAYAALAIFAYVLLAMKFRMGSFAVVGILLLPLSQMVQQLINPPSAVQETVVLNTTDGQSLEPAQVKDEFYRQERLRRVDMRAVNGNLPDFDLAVLHVCSLSWDDLYFFGLQDHPVWQRFEVIFTRFNAASTYSGPASIRVMRAVCGQQNHRALYSPPQADCLLFTQLEYLGFQNELMMNHSGRFGDFLDDIRRYGGNSAPLRPADTVPLTQRQFDGDPVYDDLALLRDWAAEGAQRKQSRALYYNSVSLHDGNRLVSKPNVVSSETYGERLKTWLDQLDAFIDELEARKRPTLLVLLPEHGAAMRGDDRQISGLREIPTPAISTVPFALKFIGPRVSDGPHRIEKPVSYQALAELIPQLIAEQSFSLEQLALEPVLNQLPETRFVSENEQVVVMQQGNQFLLHGADGNWEVLKTGLISTELGEAP